MYLIQLQQAVNLSLLILLGYVSANIYLPLDMIVVLMLFSAVWEHFLIFLKYKTLQYFSFSALSTALGVVLMMATPHLWIYMVSIAAGLVQKHFLLYRGRHLFNPSNFALITALVVFYKDAHIVLGQLGNAVGLSACVFVLAVSILWQAQRWLIPVVFTFAYLLFQYAGIVQHDPVMLFEDIYERFYSVSFIVFVLFMLTDPRTTPSNNIAQVVFAVAVALLATGMDCLYGFRVQHLFLALFAISALYALRGKGVLKKNNRIFPAIVLLLVLGAIIYIEMQPPYYFEMDR